MVAHELDDQRVLGREVAPCSLDNSSAASAINCRVRSILISRSPEAYSSYQARWRCQANSVAGAIRDIRMCPGSGRAGAAPPTCCEKYRRITSSRA